MQTVSEWVLAVPGPYRWAITLTLVVVTIVLSTTPGVEKSGDSLFVWLVLNTAPPLQKLMHVAVYAALALLWVWTLESVASLKMRVLIAFATTVGLGTALEWQQTRIPGRVGALVDVLLNAGGAILGLLIALVVL